MVDAIAILAMALLVVGVAGTVLPFVPGGLLSLSGVYLYWWNAGFSDPGALALFTFTVLGIATMLAEFFGGAVSARMGGASWGTTAIAAVVGIVLLFVTGPIGLLVGLFGAVFLLEFVRNGDVEGSARSALYATIGTLASTAVQVMLTATILIGFVLVVFVI